MLPPQSKGHRLSVSFETLSWEWATGGTLRTEGREGASMHRQSPPMTWTQGGAAAAEGPAEPQQEAPGLPQHPQ